MSKYIFYWKKEKDVWKIAHNDTENIREWNKKWSKKKSMNCGRILVSIDKDL